MITVFNINAFFQAVFIYIVNFCQKVFLYTSSDWIMINATYFKGKLMLSKINLLYVPQILTLLILKIDL